jgi:glutamine---fructose-6-phosphate transaminase (isomerizing)
MCGIVGFYGKPENVLETLVNGLHRLEYRGYDSAGVAIASNSDSLFICKATGKVAELDKKLNSQDLPIFGNVGIAHTRWATHGEPNEQNAHPHFSNDRKIAVVHNGIIENYKTLKANLQNSGVEFVSKTDTEVIAHLISKNLKTTLKQAVLDTLAALEGAFAISVVCADEPGKIIGAKKGSPLLLGVGDGEIILASDVSAVISKTRDVIYLEDGEIVEIIDGKYRITNFYDEDIAKTVQTIDWSNEQADKNGHEHFLIKEIMEQGTSITESIRGRLVLETGNIKFGGLLDVRDRIKKIKNIVLLGIGTSFYSCKMGELYFEELTGIPTKAEMTPEFRLKSNVVDENTWVIAVSQSGETYDTICAINEAKQKGALVTGIVNVVGSTISRITDAGVYNHIGPEISVASTKAFSSQVVILLMHAIYLGRMKQMSMTEGQDLIAQIKQLPNQIKTVLEQNDNVQKLAQKYYKSNDFFYIGTKYNYPIALEGALKIKEISYNVHAEGLSAGELKHGFIALVDENRPCFAIAPSDQVFDKMCNCIEQIKARHGKVIGLITDQKALIKENLDDYIVIPQIDEKIQPVLNNIILQLFAYHCSRENGFDVDKPRNLAKSVTVE